MNRLPSLWLCALTTLLIAQAVFSQSSDPQKKVVLATISGKVMFKEKPAAGVTIMLRRSDVFSLSAEMLPRAVTGQDGSYKLVGVPSGTFEVTPGAAAHVASSGSKSKPVVVGEGETIENINFSLVKGGVITGKVLDADGNPVIGQQVAVFRAEAFDQQQAQPGQPAPPPRPSPIIQIAAGTTDDRGIYRIFGIIAGRYKVAVGRGDNTFNSNLSPGRVIFKQVFHPDVTEPAKATNIEVSAGSEATNVDITLGRPVPTFSVSGKVVDGESGLPVPGHRFALQRNQSDRPEFVSSMASANSSGEFVVEGLISGKYSAFNFQDLSSEMRAEALTFEIVDQDVTDLTITLRRGGSISGVVVLESENKEGQAKLAKLQLNVSVQSPGPAYAINPGRTSQITPDGSFRFAGLASGTAFFNVMNIQGDFRNSGFALARVEREGVVQPRGVEIKDGENIAGVRLVLIYGNASLKGTIKLSEGTFPENTSFSVMLSRIGERDTMTRPPRVDARGHFVVENVAPGSYELRVTVRSPTLLSRRPTTQTVNLQDGVDTNVDIVVDNASLGPPSQAPTPTPIPRP